MHKTIRHFLFVSLFFGTGIKTTVLYSLDLVKTGEGSNDSQLFSTRLSSLKRFSRIPSSVTPTSITPTPISSLESEAGLTSTGSLPLSERSSLTSTSPIEMPTRRGTFFYGVHIPNIGLHLLIEKEAPLSEIKKLVAASPDAIDQVDDLNRTPLLVAIEKTNAVVVRYLLTQGANPNNKDLHLNTCLHRIILMIQQSRIDPLCSEEKRKILFKIFKELLAPQNDVAGYLRRHKRVEIDLDLQNRLGLTALHLAIQFGLDDVTDNLLSAGANPNIRSYGRMLTALHCAVDNKNLQATAQLLQADADSTITNRDGESATELAITCDGDILSLLVNDLIKREKLITLTREYNPQELPIGAPYHLRRLLRWIEFKKKLEAQGIAEEKDAEGTTPRGTFITQPVDSLY